MTKKEKEEEKEKNLVKKKRDKRFQYLESPEVRYREYIDMQPRGFCLWLVFYYIYS